MHEPSSGAIVSQITESPIGAMLALLKQNGSSSPVNPENVTLIGLMTFTATAAPRVHDPREMPIFAKAIASGGVTFLKASNPRQV